jgi:hypothetical protein
MCDKDIIIRSVQNCLDGMLNKTEGVSPDQLELPSWWTRQTMIALCGWGLRKGFHVCASKMKDEADMIELAQKCGGKIQGEWLNRTLWVARTKQADCGSVARYLPAERYR